MGDFLKYERFVWFEELVREGRFPNASHLAHRFEISIRSAHRCIEFMRDRLGAPLFYDPIRKGYGYHDPSFQLPRFRVTQQELSALIIARRLLLKSAGGFLGDRIRQLVGKLGSLMVDAGLRETDLDRSFSAEWHGHSPTERQVFDSAATALLNHRVLRFTYLSPADGRITLRTVWPHHLQWYMGSWVLLAFCRNRDEWRKFLTARMRDVEILEERFDPFPEADWVPLLESAFGIFQHRDTQPVTLRFNPFRARWIREQVWHPDQKVVENADGTLDLTIPVADFREIKMWILQYGADVCVLAPEALRREVADEVRKMAEGLLGE
jgi:predicted DNA-binding transcriptional regulator YafY